MFKVEYKRLLSISFSNTEHFNCTNLPITPDIVDLVIIAFNNAEVIEYQIKLLKRFFKDKYFLTIADNSSNRQKRAEIKEICNSLEVGYIAIPRNIIWKFSASRSHGAALNFIFEKYIEKRLPSFFGFLDHDIFPICETRISSILEKQPFYGLLQERGDTWYLWVGFCFYNMKLCEKFRIDFLPCNITGIYLDTGGSNFTTLYKYFNKSEIIFPPCSYEKLIDSDVSPESGVLHIGDWVHSFTGSNWRNSPFSDKKWEILKKQLAQLLDEKN